MNIKSLLLGSAVAAVAATGARAADAIVIAEPEPMEYVRVCDMYGVGYFYIPGTETCLRIGGWLRYEIHRRAGADGWDKRARSRLEFNTRNESDWGTVAGYFRIETSHNSYDSTTALAYELDENFQYSVGIGGLEMGYRDSTWTRFFGYGGFTDAGGDYGYRKNHYISYTFSGGNGFSGFVALDHDDNTDYMPDVSAGIGGTFGSVEALATVGYDESTEEFALRGKVTAPLGPVSARVIGFYASGANVYWDTADWSVLAGLEAPITEATSVAVDFQYFDGGDWRVIGNLGHQIAPGLSALLEVSYLNPDVGDDSTSGFLRFERGF
jgi:hypothetical protein